MLLVALRCIFIATTATLNTRLSSVVYPMPWARRMGCIRLSKELQSDYYYYLKKEERPVEERKKEKVDRDERERGTWFFMHRCRDIQTYSREKT